MPDLSDEQRKALEEKIKNMSPEELKEFQKQQCIFCQIIAGKVPSKKVYDDEKCIAVMDINPAIRGHILVIPKEHYAIMPQIPEKEVGHFFLVAKYLSQMVLKVLRVGGTNIFVANGLAAGQRSQQFMLHVIPRKEGDGLFNAEEKLLPLETREKVKQVVEQRMNELLGVKKGVVAVKGEVTKGKASPKEEVEPEEGAPAKATEQVQAPPEPEKRKKRAKKQPEPEQPTEPESSPEGGVSLDDIAALFK